MKIKLLIIVTALGMPIYLSAQTKVFLYNEGVMTVKSSDVTKTTLYINGDLKTGSNGTGSNETHCEINLSGSKTVLTGDFLHNDLYENGTTGANVFNFATTDQSVFSFAGDSTQHIKSSNSTYATIPNKELSYINFPTLMVNNDLSASGVDLKAGAVLVDPAMAIKAKTINLTKGWLVLQSEIIEGKDKSGIDLPTKYFPSGVVSGSQRRTALANLMLDQQAGSVIYNLNEDNYWNRGVIEVDLALRTATEAAETGTTRKLTAFGSPFKTIIADYFMWNFLFSPTNTDLFGSNGSTIADPHGLLQAGRGYLLGIDLRGLNYSSYSWSIEYPGLNETKFNARAVEGYKFNRSLYANANPTASNNNAFGTDVSKAAYTDEKLNGEEDVTIDLAPGYNYLANPYTTPLNITPLLTTEGTLSNWSVAGKSPIVVGSASTTNRNIMNRVWIVNNTNSTGQGSTLKNDRKVSLQMSYYLAKKSGSTYPQNNEYLDGGNGTSVTIPPLQMFLVYAYNACTIKIPRSAQVMGNATFMRSATAVLNEAKDDFVFEVVDKNTGALDRTSIVLRSNKEILENPENTNVTKIKALSASSDDAITPTTDEDGLGNGFSSLLYTKSDNNKLLMSNYLAYSNYQSSVSTTLYLQPSLIQQDVTINALRLGSLTEFEEVIIKDKLTGIEKVLTPTDYSFSTTTKPTDSSDRFTLVFKRNTTGIEDEINNEKTKSISSYYNSGVLTVTGFDESDFGSTLSIYDIQGRLIKQASVNDFTVNVSHPFVSGAYIVKVVGNSSYISKFLAK